MSTVVPPPPVTGVRASGLDAGSPAPPFSLPAGPDGRRAALPDAQGSPALLIFYPLDFTPVCTSELNLFNELLPDFERAGCRMMAISVDSPWAHAAFAAEQRLSLPLLPDFHPKGAVSKQYRVYRQDDGFSERIFERMKREGVKMEPGFDPLKP